MAITFALHFHNRFQIKLLKQFARKIFKVVELKNTYVLLFVLVPSIDFVKIDLFFEFGSPGPKFRTFWTFQFL